MINAQMTFIPILCYLVSFLICGIPFGVFIARYMGVADLTKTGSGNIGTTNALRSAGPKAGLLTLLLDCSKGIICVIVTQWIVSTFVFNGNAEALRPGGEGDLYLALSCLSCLLGHVFSPWLRFKGGKGIAVGFGVCLAWILPLGLSLLIPFIVAVLITKYVSFGSILAGLCLPLFFCVFYQDASLASKLIFVIMGIIVIWAHRTNIVKLVNHSESKVSFSRSKSQ